MPLLLPETLQPAGARWSRADDRCKIRPGLYQFAAIDDCSRFLVAGVARYRNAKSTLAFLDQVLDEMPFSIQRIQTDRGADTKARRARLGLGISESARV